MLSGLSSHKPMHDSWRFSLILIVFISFMMTGCVNSLGYSVIQNDRFTDETLQVASIAVIVSGNMAAIGEIGKPLAQRVADCFQNAGYAVRTEILIANPQGLGSAIDFSHAKQVDAIMLIRVGPGYSSKDGSNWGVSFNVLDSKGNGVWRGATYVQRLRDTDATFKALSRQIVEILDNGKVINFSNQSGDLPI